MSMILLLMGLLKSDVKEVNVKSVDLFPVNSIVEKAEAKQEQQQSKVNKARHHRQGSLIGFSSGNSDAKVNRLRRRGSLIGF